MLFAKIHLWSDSTDVLYWLREIRTKWPNFIANLCADIATILPDAYWYYINSADNHVDAASRGILARELVSLDLRCHCPKRLR